MILYSFIALILAVILVLVINFSKGILHGIMSIIILAVVLSFLNYLYEQISGINPWEVMLKWFSHLLYQ